MVRNMYREGGLARFRGAVPDEDDCLQQKKIRGSFKIACCTTQDNAGPDWTSAQNKEIKSSLSPHEKELAKR